MILNDKIYVGQAVSHILNHKKYRPHLYLKERDKLLKPIITSVIAIGTPMN